MEWAILIKVVLFAPFILFAYWRGWYDYILPNKIKRHKKLSIQTLSENDTMQLLLSSGYTKEEAEKYTQELNSD